MVKSGLSIVVADTRPGKCVSWCARMVQNYKPVSDVSNTKPEIRLHPFATYHSETAVASAAKPVAPECCDQGVASEADESQSETDYDELDSAELFEQQVRQAMCADMPSRQPSSGSEDEAWGALPTSASAAKVK